MNHKTTVHAAADLCEGCGLCCAGLLFNRVRLDEGEPKSKPDAELISLGPGQFGLAHPCQFLEGTRCGIYAERPTRCQGFSCLSRRRVLNGEIEFDAAVALIEETKSLLEQLAPLTESVAGMELKVVGFRQFTAQFSKTLQAKLESGEMPFDVEREALTVTFEIIKIVDRSFRQTSRLNLFARLVYAVDQMADGEAPVL